jgi:hypothetical protein
MLDREQTVLQGMTDRPAEVGEFYGTEMDVDKTKVMRI